MILDIVLQPNVILREQSRPLSNQEILQPDNQQLIHNMLETMHEKDGIGLAAPQVGKSLQICVITKNFTNEQKQDLILINPTWKKAGFWKAWGDEGCLSVPDIYGDVKRYKKIKVQALDINGKLIKFSAKNFLARIIQHEVDHLNGVLFIEKARNLHKVLQE